MTALASMLAGEIRAGEYQGMAALNAWTYEDLKADIQKNGVEVPIVVNEDFVIIDGHHRWKIALELDIADTVPVEVHAYGSRAATQAAAIRLNVMRRQISKEERNRLVLHMRELLGMTQQEVADRLGLSRQRVTQIEADSPKQETSNEECDPLEAAKAKAKSAKGTGRPNYKFTTAESAAVQAEIERLHADGLKQYEIADQLGLAKSAVARRLNLLPKDEDDDKSSPTDQIAACARRGMTSPQIAAHLGRGRRGDEWVREQARAHDIDIPADRASKKKRIDSDAAMGRAIEQLSAALYAFQFISTHDLDQERKAEWSRSLDDIAKSIRTLIRQLNRPAKEQDQS